MAFGDIVAGAIGGAGEQAVEVANKAILDESKMKELRQKAEQERQRLAEQHKLSMEELKERARLTDKSEQTRYDRNRGDLLEDRTDERGYTEKRSEVEHGRELEKIRAREAIKRRNASQITEKDIRKAYKDHFPEDEFSDKPRPSLEEFTAAVDETKSINGAIIKLQGGGAAPGGADGVKPRLKPQRITVTLPDGSEVQGMGIYDPNEERWYDAESGRLIKKDMIKGPPVHQPPVQPPAQPPAQPSGQPPAQPAGLIGRPGGGRPPPTQAQSRGNTGLSAILDEVEPAVQGVGVFNIGHVRAQELIAQIQSFLAAGASNADRARAEQVLARLRTIPETSSPPSVGRSTQGLLRGLTGALGG